MFRSFSRVGELVPVVMSILERRLRAGAVLRRWRTRRCAPGSTGWRPRRRAATRPSPTWPATSGSGTSTSRSWRRWSPPEYDDDRARASTPLEADPGGPGTRPGHRAPGALAAPAARSAAPPLARSTATADFRTVLLEVYARRYYRIRELRDLQLRRSATTTCCASADYDWENKHIHLVVAYAALDAAARGRPGRGRAPARRTGRTGRSSSISPPGADGPHIAVDETGPAGRGAARRLRLRPRAVAARRDRDQHRTATQAEHFRTQHLTYRPAAGGGLLRGPALPQPAPDAGQAPGPVAAVELPARAAGVGRGRLPLPRGGPRQPEGPPALRARRGPRPDRGPDRRRHRRPTRGSSGSGCRPWPRCAPALATFPARERPTANRIVLYVRPPWDVPRESWPRPGAQSFAPLAEGVGLEKVLLRVRIPEPDGSAARRRPATCRASAATA